MATPETAPLRPATHEPRLPALDGLRGVAILLVLGYHLIPRIPGATPAARTLEAAAGVGWMGVDLFFVLSGFLITGILLDARGEPGSLRAFYVRRALRILPVYYGIVGLFALLAVALGSVDPQWRTFRDAQGWYWLHATNVLLVVNGEWSAAPLWTGHFWSLAVEEQFYLLWPALVLTVPRRFIGRLCAATVVVAIATRAALVTVAADDLAPYVLLPARMDALAIGGWLAWAARAPAGLTSVARGIGWAALASAAALAGTWALDGRHLTPNGSAMQVVGFSATAVLAGALLVRVVLAPQGSATGRLAAAPWLRRFGLLSYGLYVYHLIVWGSLQGSSAYGRLVRTLGAGLLGHLAQLAIAMALSVAVAWISWYGWEKRWLALKDRFPYRARAKETPRQPAVTPAGAD